MIFRRMSPSAWDAPSAISSSDKIEEAIFSSRYLLGVKASKRQSIEVSSPSERFLHWIRPRITLKTSATFNSSPIDREAPA